MGQKHGHYQHISSTSAYLQGRNTVVSDCVKEIPVDFKVINFNIKYCTLCSSMPCAQYSNFLLAGLPRANPSQYHF